MSMHWPDQSGPTYAYGGGILLEVFLCLVIGSSAGVAQLVMVVGQAAVHSPAADLDAIAKLVKVALALGFHMLYRCQDHLELFNTNTQ